MKKLIYIVLLLVICPGLSFSQKPGNIGGKAKKPELVTPEHNTFVEPDTTLDYRKNRRINTEETADSTIPRAQIVVSTLQRGDSLMFRWAVTTPGGWVTANRLGYIIKRTELSSNPGSEESILLTPEPLHPWSLEEWKSNSDPKNMYAAIAAQCLYGRLSTGKPEASSNPSDFVQNLKYASMELQNKHGFALFAADMDAHTANGLALRYVDKALEKGKKYLYTISTNSQDPSYLIEIASIAVAAGKESLPVPPPSAPVIEEMDSKLKLTWNPEINEFTAYDLYRYDDQKRDYIKLNDQPIVPMQPSDPQIQGFMNDNDFPAIFIDSNLVNGKSYSYCLRGITSFAEVSPCVEVKASPRDMTPPLAPIVSSKQISANSLLLEWKHDGKEADLLGFVIMKSSDMDDGYSVITPQVLNADTRSFIDDSAKEYMPYYKVFALDKTHNYSISRPHLAQIIDKTPPSKPAGLYGDIDSAGYIYLSWDINPERNVKGYRVLRSNAPDHEFSEVAGELVAGNTFIDHVDLNTLTKNVYYKLLAVNSHNRTSEESDVLEIARPDFIPPHPSVFKAYMVTDSSVILKWEYSRSRDVALQLVLRKKAGQTDWTELIKLDPGVSFYEDKNIEDNTSYEYAIATFDNAGNFTYSDGIIKAQTSLLISLSDIDDIIAEYNPVENAIKISWKYSGEKNENTWFEIYRQKIDPGSSTIKPVLYESVPSEDSSFTDRSLTGNGSYKYQLKLIRNGGVSQTYKEAVVIVK